MLNFKRYKRNPVVHFPEREWPNKEIEKAPIWCSVDLRDGNQALIDPMVVGEKIEFFQYLVNMGFKEIEVGFPAASQIEYDFLRQLIDRRLIPDDVRVQVLTQCREELIDRTFEAIEGCKQAIVHIYNSTSTLQRDVVFNMDRDQITEIAVKGTQMVKERAAKFGGKIILEYSPESFTGTELDFALDICTAVQEAWGATKDNKIIINIDTDDNKPVYPRITINHGYSTTSTAVPHSIIRVADNKTYDYNSTDMVENTVYYNGTTYYWKPSIAQYRVENTKPTTEYNKSWTVKSVSQEPKLNTMENQPTQYLENRD